MVIFYLLAAAILVFSVLSVTSRRILRAATYLLLVLMSTAGIYFLLDVMFLAGVQLMLYAGGIMVLVIFSILLTSNIDHKFEVMQTKKKISSWVLTMVGAIFCITTILQHDFVPVQETPMEPTMRAFGTSLMSYGQFGYVLPFEVITVLLLAAMIGAIMVAKKK